MASKHVLKRLSAIKEILSGAHSGGHGLAAATIGAERESFINLVLSNVIAPPFRIGTGEITDSTGETSGQVDIVIEYAGSISFPLLQGSSPRLYLADGACAVIEVKSNLRAQWDDIERKAGAIYKLNRELEPTLAIWDHRPPSKIPFFAVGYEGWRTAEPIENRLDRLAGTDVQVDGVLVINSGIYRGRTPDYSEHDFNGRRALYGLLLSIEQITSSMVAAKPPFMQYVT